MNLVTKSKIPLPILSIPGRLLCTSSTHPVVDQFGWSCAIHYRFRVLLENSVMPGAPPVSTPNYISCFGTFLFSTSLDQRCRHLHHPSPWNRRGRGCKQVSYYEHKKKTSLFWVLKFDSLCYPMLTVLSKTFCILTNPKVVLVVTNYTRSSNESFRVLCLSDIYL